MNQIQHQTLQLLWETSRLMTYSLEIITHYSQSGNPRCRTCLCSAFPSPPVTTKISNVPWGQWPLLFIRWFTRHGKCFVHEYTMNVRKNVNGKNGQARSAGVSLSAQLRKPIGGGGGKFISLSTVWATEWLQDQPGQVNKALSSSKKVNLKRT